MLALNGNTAPYLQYAHARICSIFRRAGLDIDDYKAAAVISQVEERNLMMKLMEFTQAVSAVAAELRPHILCNYLYELAVCFSAFYDKCPVLACDNEKVRASRLMISGFTRRTLARGLELLGIAAPREM
jgi:arginyl-tRNA synthetase